MKKLTTILLTVSAIACGGNKQGAGAVAGKTAETDRYYKALDASFEGDSRAGYDGLLELAADSPDTRAGRKARAVLMADDPLVYIAGIGALSAIAIPGFGKYQTKAKQSEGSAIAKIAYVVEQSYFAEHKRYCKTVKECEGMVPESPRYIVVLGPKEIVRPVGMERAISDNLAKRAQGALLPLAIKTGVTKKGFTIAVVGNVDDDDEIDLWTIDQDNLLVHVIDDLSE